MFLAESKGKCNIDAIFKIPNYFLNTNSKCSFIHNFSAVKEEELVT